MRLVVPYAELRAATYRATKEWPEVEYRYVGDTDTAYAELLAELWADRRTFAICEHDVVPTPGMLAELAMCRHPYCAYPVALSVYIAPCMSLTKFSGTLLEQHPDVMERVLKVPTNWGPPGHWRQLDTVLQRTVLLNRYGLQPHLHSPAVEHLNEEKSQLIPGAKLRPYIPAFPALSEPG